MRGYKDLFEVQEYRSEYRKPTRKDFLHKKKESVGFQNPLKEAISNRKVDKAHDLYYLRPVSKLAPSYMHRLLDLDGKLQPMQPMKSDHLLDIRFSPQVQEERSPAIFFKHHKESIWKEPELLCHNKLIKSITLSKEKETSTIEQVDHGLHKSSWLRDVSRPETIRRLSVSVPDSNYFKMGLKPLKEPLKEEEGIKKETYSTRNVDFMLDIWQKSEGVNLDKFLQEEERVKHYKKIEAKERAMDLAKEKESRIEENQLYLQAFNANMNRNSDEEADKCKKPNENLNTDGTVFQLTSLTEELSNIAERQVPKRRKSVAVNAVVREKEESSSFSSRLNTPNKAAGSLSKSTIKVLKKLSKDVENSKSAIHDDPNDLLKLTLTGPQEADMQTYFLSDCNRSFVPIRVKRRHLETTYSPGAWSKLMKSSFLSNGEIRISESITNDIEQDKRQFQLILYDLNALDDQEDENTGFESDEDQDIIDEAEEMDSVLPEILEQNSSQSPQSSKEDIRPTPMQRRLSKFQRRLSVYNKVNPAAVNE